MVPYARYSGRGGRIWRGVGIGKSLLKQASGKKDELFSFFFI